MSEIRITQGAASKNKLKDKKITIYRATSSNDSDGYAQYTYMPIHSGKLWAYVRQTSGREYYVAMALQVSEEMVFVVNWRDDLTMKAARSLFIEYRGNWYDVQRIDTYEGYKNDIQLFAKSTFTPKTESILSYEETTTYNKGE